MKAGMTEQKKQAVIEQLWLTYYNDTLFAVSYTHLTLPTTERV